MAAKACKVEKILDEVLIRVYMSRFMIILYWHMGTSNFFMSAFIVQL